MQPQKEGLQLSQCYPPNATDFALQLEFHREYQSC